MLTADNCSRCRVAIRRTLAYRTGVDPDARAVAAATLNIWKQMAVQLAPVIGARGVAVLFGRSLHLVGAAFPWLAIAGDQADNPVSLASLKARLAGQETGAAAEAGYALLVTFTELLATMIGESLTERLLSPVWGTPSLESERVTTS